MYFVRRFFAFCVFGIGFEMLSAASLDADQKEDAFSNDEPIVGRSLLDACDSSLQCSYVNKNSYCTDRQCFCAPDYLMLTKDSVLKCFGTVKIGGKCLHDEQCRSVNTKAGCVNGICQCKTPFKNLPECKIDHRNLTKSFNMSFLINIVMATIIGIIVLLFIICFLCVKCQKHRTATNRRQANNPSRQSVMSANAVEKPPSYDELYIGSPIPPIGSPTLLRPPSYDQVFVYGEVAVPVNYPANVAMEDFPSRR